MKLNTIYGKYDFACEYIVPARLAKSKYSKEYNCVGSGWWTRIIYRTSMADGQGVLITSVAGGLRERRLIGM